MGSPSRSRSRSPIKLRQEEDSIDDVVNNDPVVMKEDGSDVIHKTKPKFEITLSNFPKTWNGNDVKNFICRAVKSKYVTDNLVWAYYRYMGPDKPRLLVVKFSYKEAADEACEQLKDFEIDGKKLCPTRITFQQKKDYVTGLVKPVIHFGHRDRNLGINVFQGDFTKQTYGLNINFLESLDIKPPLSPKIFVSNLAPQVDKQKIEEIFSLAGKVIYVHIKKYPDGLSKGFATVKYDHPVEAVQAISMFNYQSLYGSKMTVRLDRKNISMRLLPLGLSDIGPGLGEDGNPLPYVRAHIEIEELKHQIRESMVTASDTNKTTNLADTKSVPMWESHIAPVNPQIPNSVNFGNTTTPGVNLDLQNLLQSLVQQANLIQVLGAQSKATVPSNIGTSNGDETTPVQKSNSRPKICHICRLPGHQGAHCRFARCDFCKCEGHSTENCKQKDREEFSQQAQFSAEPSNISHQGPDHDGMTFKSSRGENETYDNSSDLVVFTNLPASVTIEALKNKMEEVGEVRFAELTARGKAIVRFYRPREAHKCIILFNRSRVDGQEIEVQYI